MFGFAYSVILLLVSSIYLYQGIQNRRLEKQVTQGLEPINADRRMSASTKAIMQLQMREEESKSSGALKALYGIYCMALLLMVIMIITRFSSLVAHSHDLNQIDVFPSSCSSWVPEDGCCYISMKDDCERE